MTIVGQKETLVSSGTRGLSCSAQTGHESNRVPTVFRLSGTPEVSCADKTESGSDRVPLMFRKLEHEEASCPTLYYFACLFRKRPQQNHIEGGVKDGTSRDSNLLSNRLSAPPI